MVVKMSNEYSVRDLFNNWRNDMEALEGAQFAGAERRRLFGELCVMLKAWDIDFDAAKTLKKDAVDVVTTKHGRSGGAYSKWRETASQDFETVVAGFYVEDAEEKEQISKLVVDDRIVQWCEGVFGSDCPQMLVDQAHQIGHALNIQYIDETFK